jgi:hypothetical protein
MAGVTAATCGDILKDVWADGVAMELLKESAALALVGKNEKFAERGMYIDVVYAGNRARSASFSNARSNGSASQNEAFYITRKANYAFGSIDRQVMKQAQAGNRAALVDALVLESKTMVKSYKQDMGADLYSDGSGKRGRVSAIASAVITLTDPNDTVHFEKGDILVLNTASTGAAGTERAGTVTLAGVDRDAGTLTCTGNVTAGIAAAAANDYVYHQGDGAAKPVGFGGWIPATAPTTGDNFFTVDRSVDPTRLAGIRYDGSSLNHEEALIKGLLRMSRDGAFPRHVMLHPDDFGALELILGSRKQYEDVEGPAGIGFTALTVNGPKGKVLVFVDPWAIKGYAFALTIDTWTLHSLGPVPDWVDEDGNKLQRQTTADGFEFMLAGYYQFGCDDPGQNGRITLPS